MEPNNNNPTQNNSNPPTTSTPYSPPLNSPPTPSPKFDIHEFIRNHKILSIFILLGSIFFLTAVIVLIFSRTPKTEEPETAPYPYFEHRYLLDYSLGQSITNTIFSSIGDTMLSPEEISSAPIVNPNENAYTVSFDEASFKVLKDQPGQVYKVNLNLSDQRTYALYIYTDQDWNYIVVVLDRTDSSNIADHIYIYTLEGEEDKYSQEINSWLKQFNLTTPITTNLLLPDLDQRE